MQIIGIDCSTNPKGMGFALGRIADGCCQVETAVAGTCHAEHVKRVCQWLASGTPTLLCVDAPLGWPAPLAPSLCAHVAGRPVPEVADQLFRRETDRDVKRRLNKQPLDVGADRIARTAHAALVFLEALRKATGAPLPMAWSPDGVKGHSVIEVYPAATLVARGFKASGYKKPEHIPERQEILTALGNVMELPEDPEPLLNSADALDAAVYVLAGFDFLCGACPAPADPERARKEGWIWVCSPST